MRPAIAPGPFATMIVYLIGSVSGAGGGEHGILSTSGPEKQLTSFQRGMVVPAVITKLRRRTSRISAGISLCWRSIRRQRLASCGR
jgi:hypothetical protein